MSFEPWGQPPSEILPASLEALVRYHKANYISSMSPIYQSLKNKTMFSGLSRFYFLLGGVSFTGFTFVMNISRIVYLFKVIDKFQMCETSQKYNIIISCFPSLRFSQPLQPDALLCPVINSQRNLNNCVFWSTEYVIFLAQLRCVVHLYLNQQ